MVVVVGSLLDLETQKRFPVGQSQYLSGNLVRRYEVLRLLRVLKVRLAQFPKKRGPKFKGSFFSCPVCSKGFYLRPYFRDRKRQDLKYCSRECVWETGKQRGYGGIRYE